MAAAADEAGLEAFQPDPDYSDRPGSMRGSSDLRRRCRRRCRNTRPRLPTNDGIELKYYHYSVIMNAERKLAFVSAVNLDGGAEFQLRREAKDRWFYRSAHRPRPSAGNDLYVDNPLDRGHFYQTRRRGLGRHRG